MTGTVKIILRRMGPIFGLETVSPKRAQLIAPLEPALSRVMPGSAALSGVNLQLAHRSEHDFVPRDMRRSWSRLIRRRLELGGSRRGTLSLG